MAEQQQAPTPAPSAPSGGDLHPSFNSAPAPQHPAMPAQPPARPEDNNARQAPHNQGYSPAMQQRAQAAAPGTEDRMIEVGRNQVSERAVLDALAHKSEMDVRKNLLPKAENDFEVRNSPDFALPEGVKWEFDPADPLLAQAKKVAIARGLDQETFSSLLDLYVSDRIGSQMQLARQREQSLLALGAAAPQRLAAISQWLTARAGPEGAALGGFLAQYPAPKFVKAMENVIRQFSSQGGSDFDQRGRATESEQGRIPNYENLSFVERRAAQMALLMRQQRPGYRGGNSER